MALIAAVVACSFPSSPQPPIASLVASTQQAATFEDTIVQAVQQAGVDGQFSATVTQDQFSSWLQLKAPQYAKDNKQDWPFKNGQAAFKNGKVQIYAILTQPNTPETAVQLVLIPVIDANSEFQMTVDSAQLGIMGVPGPLLAKITDIIQTAVNGQMSCYKGKYKLSQLSVGDGTVTVAGRIIRS